MTYAPPATLWTSTDTAAEAIFMTIAVRKQDVIAANNKTVPTRLSAPMKVQVDTGSQGVVVNLSYLFSGPYEVNLYTSGQQIGQIESIASGNLLPGVTFIKGGQIEYSSRAGVVHKGGYFQVSCLSLGDNSLATQPMAFILDAHILGVMPVGTSGSAYSGKGIAPDALELPGPLMMGVGFGRNDMGTNLFLNAVTVGKVAYYPSYTVNATSIAVGEQYSPGDSSGYVFQNLTSSQIGTIPPSGPVNPSFLSTPKGQVTWTATGSKTSKPSPAPTGDVLIDSGITDMLLTYPINLDEGNLLVQINSNEPGTWAAQYSFNITSNSTPYSTNVNENKLAPTEIKLKGSDSSSNMFVNTGFHALRSISVYLDMIGSNPHAAPSGPRVGYLQKF